MSPEAREAACFAIRYHHRERRFAMESRKRIDLALGAHLRMQLGWTRDMPKPERDAIAARAAAMMADKDFERLGEWADIVLASRAAREPFVRIEAAAAKQMEKLAKGLPVWSGFAEAVRGFGAVSLAAIVAEAGDLSGYPKKGHLWKRMGLAVMDGTRQGGLSGAAKGDWIAHGYSPQRRSAMFVIGDVLIKHAGLYRDVYLDRKAYERARAEAEGLVVAPSAKIPKARAAEFMSDGHIHRRAQRYMEKRLLRDLWQAWNGREAKRPVPLSAEHPLPSARSQPLAMEGLAA